MSHWSGEMEFEFVEGQGEDGAFVATSKVVQFLRNHLAKGQIKEAIRLYEDTGSNAAAELLEDAKVASSGTQESLAQMFAGARDFANAAKVFELARNHEQAAAYYEQGAQWADAARMFEKLGQVDRAAKAHERAGGPERALELYAQSGPTDGYAQCLARVGRYNDAAHIYRQLNNLRGEIDMLRLVPIQHQARVPAVLRLSELLVQFNHADQAVGLLLETIQQSEAARLHQPMYMSIAQILEQLGRHDQAAKVRAQISNQLAAAPAPAAPAPVAAAALAPSSVEPPSDPFGGLVDPFAKSGGGQLDAYAHLKAIPIFAELAMDDMQALYRTAREARFAQGQTLIEQGQPGQGLIVLVTGSAHVVRVDASGQSTTLASLGPGDYVGDMSLIDESPTSARVVAAAPLQALAISKDRFFNFLYGRDDAAARVFRLFTRTLAQRLREANKR